MAKETYINKSSIKIHGVYPGEEFDMDVDENGTPIELKWRRRVRDAKIDSCIEKKASIKKKKAAETTADEK